MYSRCKVLPLFEMIRFEQMLRPETINVSWFVFWVEPHCDLTVSMVTRLGSEPFKLWRNCMERNSPVFLFYLFIFTKEFRHVIAISINWIY